MIEVLTKGVLGLLAIIIGVSILGWVLYNEFVERSPGYEKAPLAGPLGVGPPMVGVGVYWVRQCLQYFFERRRIGLPSRGALD